MKVLITGASGLLGTELTRELRINGNNCDVLAPSRKELDLFDKSLVEKYIQHHRPTHVYHLAATVMGVGGHSLFPLKSHDENNLIDSNIFAALKQYPPTWIYYSSSVAAYGHPYTSLPLKESELLIGAPHKSEFGYAISKRKAIRDLDWLRAEMGVTYIYGLTTNLFGDSDRFQNGNGHVIISLLTKALMARQTGEQLRPWGSGNASRDFISSKDAARILTDIIGLNVGLLNIASGNELRISSIVELIAKKMDLSNGFEFTGSQEGITRRWCDITNLSRYTNLENLESVNEYIDRFIKLKLS